MASNCIQQPVRTVDGIKGFVTGDVKRSTSISSLCKRTELGNAVTRSRSRNSYITSITALHLQGKRVDQFSSGSWKHHPVLCRASGNKDSLNHNNNNGSCIFREAQKLVAKSIPVVLVSVAIVLAVRSGKALAAIRENTGLPMATQDPAKKGAIVALGSAWAGLVAGFLHTLTGPDHLAALAPLCIGRRSKLESAAIGALWGCGHDAGQLLFGTVFLLLKDKLHIEVIRTWGTRVVGLTLVIIGVVGIKEAQEVPVLNGAQVGGVQEAGKKSLGLTFATGIVYGLQPDALLMILPALAMPSRLAGISFLSMFLLGTVLAMSSYTVFLGSCSEALHKRLPWITQRLSWISSLVAIGFGIGILLSEFFGVSIF